MGLFDCGSIARRPPLLPLDYTRRSQHSPIVMVATFTKMPTTTEYHVMEVEVGKALLPMGVSCTVFALANSASIPAHEESTYHHQQIKENGREIRKLSYHVHG